MSAYKALTAVLVFLLALSGGARAQDQELVIISPHWDGIRREFEEAFRRQEAADGRPPVSVRWLDVGGTSEMLRYLRAQYREKPGGIGVDLVFGGGTDPYLELKKEGSLQKVELPAPLLAELAPEICGSPLRDGDGTWYAATMAGFGIIYNKTVLRRLGLREPQTWADLADPAWRGWVMLADPRRSGSAHMAYEIILQAYGWEKGWRILAGLAANARSFRASSAEVPQDVALGEAAAGPAIDSYAWAQVAEAGAETIGFLFPADLSVVSGDGIALLKGAPNPEIARRFLHFVLSEKGQKLWMLRAGDPEGPRRHTLGKFSVMPQLYGELVGRTPVRLDPFSWKTSFRYDAAKGGQRWSALNDLLGTFLVEPRESLASWWAENNGAELAAPESEDLIQNWCVSGAWKKPEFRSAKLRAWSGRAGQLYGARSFSLWSLLPTGLALLVLVRAVWQRWRRV